MDKVSLLRKIDHHVGAVLLFFLRPISIILGILLKRDHSPEVRNELVVLKLLGGGSIVMAYQALLSLKQKYPTTRLILVCSPSVKTYAELLGVFDDFLIVNLNSVIDLASSALKVITRLFRTDCLVNLEAHSKLATVFALLTCARNRIGFYQSWNRWQRGLATNLFFFNTHAATYESYNQVARALGASTVDQSSVCEHFVKANNFGANKHKLTLPTEKSIALSPFCSELGREREFSHEEWISIIKLYASSELKHISVLGGPADVKRGEDLCRFLSDHFTQLKIENHCGKYSLRDSVEYACSLGEFFTIDSGLNHLVRLLGIPITSFWGPTDPQTRLVPITNSKERIFYKKIFCSPCVHIVHKPPCHGNNLCMKQHLGIDVKDALARGWDVLQNNKDAANG